MKTIICIGLMLNVYCGCNSPAFIPATPKIKHIHGSTMGTTYEIKLGLIPKDCDIKVLSQAVEEELKLVTQQMSTWEPQSEISRFNQLSTTEWFPVSQEFAFVVSRSIDYFKETQGKFDITIPPLLDLWNFGKLKTESFIPPTKEQIQIAQLLVNSNLLEVTLDPPALRKLNPELKIEVSAIAQGHGIDRVRAVLEKFQIANYMIEIGGELLVRGTKPDGLPWRIAIEKPVPGERQIELILETTSGSIGTSGSYRHFTTDSQSTRYSHIIDPQSGIPVDHNLVSVSVVSQLSSLDVDVLTTSLMVMGPELGFNYAESHQLAVVFFEQTRNGQLKISKTSAFKLLQEVTP